MSDVQTRINSTLSRVDQVLAERTRREIEALRAEDEAQARADAMRAKADVLKRTEIQSKYDVVFRAFGERCPMPAGDESPGRFRRRLYENLRQRLPSNHDLAQVYADDLGDPTVRNHFERMVIDAALVEAERPSAENLPPTGQVRRDTVDEATGSRTVNWYGQRSFIADMGNPLKQRVTRFYDPKTGRSVW